MGYNNRVSGTGHRILVDNVVVKGNGGWVLKKNLNGNSNDGGLIMGDYRIDLDNLHNIKRDFRDVIQYIGNGNGNANANGKWIEWNCLKFFGW